MEQDLLQEFGNLQGKLEDNEMKLEREKDTSELYHQRFRDTDTELKNKQREMVALPLRITRTTYRGCRLPLTVIMYRMGMPLSRF